MHLNDSAMSPFLSALVFMTTYVINELTPSCKVTPRSLLTYVTKPHCDTQFIIWHRSGQIMITTDCLTMSSNLVLLFKAVVVSTTVIQDPIHSVPDYVVPYTLISRNQRTFFKRPTGVYNRQKHISTEKTKRRADFCKKLFA